MTRCASWSPTRSARIIAGCGMRAPRRKWTKTGFARSAAGSRRAIRRWRAGLASCSMAARAMSPRRGWCNKSAAMKARIHISLKPGVLDPQGQAIGNALKGLGFGGVGEVRQGKLIELELAESDPGAARARVEAMCRQLLANPRNQNYAIQIPL